MTHGTTPAGRVATTLHVCSMPATRRSESAFAPGGGHEFPGSDVDDIGAAASAQIFCRACSMVPSNGCTTTVITVVKSKRPDALSVIHGLQDCCEQQNGEFRPLRPKGSTAERKAPVDVLRQHCAGRRRQSGDFTFSRDVQAIINGCSRSVRLPGTSCSVNTGFDG